MYQVTGIRLLNVRTFEGEHLIPLSPGLTVLMGRNNAGKSTVLRAPFLRTPSGKTLPVNDYCRAGSPHAEVALRFALPLSEFETMFGLTSRLGDIHVAQDGKQRQLSRHAQFTHWPTEPVVELGQRFFAGSLGFAMFSLVGTDGARFDTFPIQQTVEPVTLASGVTRTTAQAHWFSSTFAFVEDRESPRNPHLVAHWEHDRAEQVSGWIDQPRRRVIDTNEARLQATLTYLRLKHASEFEHISRALHRALPEFVRLDFIEVADQDFGYRPCFVARGSRDRNLARESIGSGAWTYLCILTAARAAKVTGARVLMLDEPHLYLHPGLERLLIDELLDPALWDGAPLQVVAATHSPTFVDAAIESGVLNIIDWKDEARTSASVTTVDRKTAANVFDGLVSQPSDLLYSDRIVFVEGPSDIVALRMLARERCGVKKYVRFVPMRQTDGIATEVARYFRVIVDSHLLGFQTRGLVVLDRDKEAALTAAWTNPKSADVDPSTTNGLQVVWLGTTANDIESTFCDEAFLRAYFAERGADPSALGPLIATALADVRPTGQKQHKGCVAIERLHTELLQVAGRKADHLDALMRFYIGNAAQPFAAVPLERLKDLEVALRSF